MFKKILLIVLLLLPLFFLVIKNNSEKINNNSEKVNLDKKLHTDCLYPILLITNKDFGSHGTGFVVRCDKVDYNKYENVFITCGHVCRQEADYSVTYFQYSNWSEIKKSHEYPCYIYSKNLDLDLAIGIFVSDRPIPICHFDFDYETFIGANIFRIGCGLGDNPRLDRGHITASKSTIFDQDVLKTNIYTLPGDSGSPVFSSDYKVIGIMQAIKSNTNSYFFSVSYALPLEYIKKWNEEDNNAYNFLWSDDPIPRFAFYKLDINNQIEVVK